MAKTTKAARPLTRPVIYTPADVTQVDRVLGHDELGPILPVSAYDEEQLKVRKELFGEAQAVLNWGGSLSYDDLLLLKATARALLLSGITRGDYGLCGPPMIRMGESIRL